MAFVAETVGARPLEFGDPSKIMKGAAEAANLYAAQQKAEQVGMELENMRLKQGEMKVGITLDYLDKINKAANPTVKKILMKQFGSQFEKMYGQPVDQDTLNAVSNTPDIGAVLESLKDSYGTGLSGDLLNAHIELFGKGLAGPYAELGPFINKLADVKMEEEKAKAATQARSQKLSIYEENVMRDNLVASMKFQSDLTKDLENRREKLTALDRGFTLVNDFSNFGSLSKKERIAFDDALVTTFTKTLDPTSVVMPSEYIRTLMTQPTIDRAQAYLRKEFKKDTLLDPKQREAMINFVEKFTKDQAGRFNMYIDSQAANIAKIGGDPEPLMKFKYGFAERPKEGGQAPSAAPSKAPPAAPSVAPSREAPIGAQTTGITGQQRSMLDQYIQRDVPYDVFAQKNPKTSKVISRAEYDKLLMQKRAGK